MVSVLCWYNNIKTGQLWHRGLWESSRDWWVAGSIRLNRGVIEQDTSSALPASGIVACSDLLKCFKISTITNNNYYYPFSKITKTNWI